MLGKRYANDGKSLLRLNPLQRKMKRQVERKVSDGTYALENADCPACGGSGGETLAEKDRYGLYAPVAICGGCGLIRAVPRMTRDAFAAFYDMEYRKLYHGSPRPTSAFFQEQYARGERIFAYLIQHGAFPAGPENAYVLEVGCGAGGILKYFRDRGCRVKGLDLGSEYIEYGRSGHGLDLSVGTLADLTGGPRPDVVVYSHVLEHILDVEEELAQVHGILAERGSVYVEVPGVKRLWDNYEWDFLRYLQNAHVFHFSLATLTRLMARCGFHRISGDETVCSLFRKKRPEDRMPPIENDCASTLAYLKRIERIRRFSPLPVYRTAQALVTLVRKTGIEGPLRGMAAAVGIARRS